MLLANSAGLVNEGRGEYGTDGDNEQTERFSRVFRLFRLFRILKGFLSYAFLSSPAES